MESLVGGACDPVMTPGCRPVGAFCDQVAAKGVTCELMFNGAIAMLTDPGGVTIEVNSGLEAR